MLRPLSLRPAPRSVRLPPHATTWPRCLQLLAFLVCVLGTSGADAQQGRSLSGYEQESIAIAIDRIGGGERDPEPEGKIVESIEVVALEVFEERDQVPTFVNWLHVTTRDYIIEREVLIRPGQPYQQVLADETERNLRLFPQVTVVLIVPLLGSHPNTIKLLVVTKDVWSLRLSWNPGFYNGRLTSLTLAPSEWNIAGTTQSISGNLSLTARNYWVGGSYYVPRIGGSRIAAYLSGNAVLNCQSNKLEGATGLFTYGQPLYSTRTKWSWRTAMAWSSLIRQPVEELGQAICSSQRAVPIRISDLEVVGRSQAIATPISAGTGAGPIEAQSELRHDIWVPQRYREERLRGQVALTRSFNIENKVDITGGLEADQTILNDVSSRDELTGDLARYAELPNGLWRRAEVLETFGPEDPRLTDELAATARRAYRTRLALNTPATGEALRYAELVMGDRRVSPYLQLHAYTTRFLRTINYNTLGLQEDVRLGHNVYLRVYPAFRPLSSRDLLGVFTSAAYTWSYGQGFLRALVSSDIELAADGNEETSLDVAGLDQSDASLSAATHIVSPDLYFGRLVNSMAFQQNSIRYINRWALGLGGTDRLRGYQPSAFLGTSSFVVNTELRTRPIRILSTLVGVSIFHDMGDAARGPEHMELKHGGGIGLRILFPQLDRDVLRFDFGFPLQEHVAGEFTFTAGFGQVIGEPAAPPSALLTQ